MATTVLDPINNPDNSRPDDANITRTEPDHPDAPPPPHEQEGD